VFPEISPTGAYLPDRCLMAPPDEAPHSSLSFMLASLTPSSGFYAGDGWQERAAAELGAMNTPVVVFGTAFAFVHLFDWLADQGLALNLPEHSRVVETGGFKGRSREVSRDELCALFTELLGVSPTHCLSDTG
jgi:hypothetical protein